MNSTNIVYIDDDDSTRTKRQTLSIALAGPPIQEGSRNVTLTRIAGMLHDGTRTLEQLTRDLMAVNRARCKPPLPANEVANIAKSIRKRPACVPSKGKPPEEVLDFVLRHWLGVLAVEPWKGQGGGSEYKVYEALLEVAERHGWITEHGQVCVSVSVRDLAKRSGISKETCIGALKRLQRKRLLYRVPSVTKGTAGRLILRDVSPQDWDSQSTKIASPLSVPSLSELLSTLRRFRHGADRITPTMMLHLRMLLFFDEGATVTEIAKMLERRSDNVRRTLRYLKKRGLVEEISKDHYRVVSDLLEALENKLVEDGVPEVERAQRHRDEREREIYAYYLRLKEAAKRGDDLERVTPPARVVDLSSRIIDTTEEVYAPAV
jgi:DNA-binding MarR family transcriptional regulator